jgi:hypothetical protein
MRIVRSLALLGCALSLAACDPPPQSKPLDESTAEQPAPDAQAKPEPEGADKYSPMGKANRVEEKVMDAKDKQDQDIDKGAN